MASRLKEDEKNERIIRGLLKLPGNKRCINCNSLGPQYVCTTFWTFVCTNCSGIHREFTHRVKSVSMAKFTSQEVSALQGGGNERAREIYFKGLDPQRQSLPDGSNVEKLRDFIRHVYVNKRYASERNDDKPPRGKLGEKDDFNENRSPSGSRSPQYEDAYERRFSDRSSPGGRSPGFEPKYGDYGKSPSHPEIVNDWRRDDRFGSGRKSEEECRSPEQVKDLGSSTPPVVRPVREILGDNVVPLRISEPPKASVTRPADISAHIKQTAPSSSLASTNENPREAKVETSVSLIDFDANPEPPTAPTAATLVQQSTATPQPVIQATTSANDEWASFDTAPGVNVSQSSSYANTLDSLLSQLSVPASTPVQTSGQPGGPGASMAGTAFQANPPVAIAGNIDTVSDFGTGGNYVASVSSFSSVPTGVQWPNLQQQQPSLLPPHDSYSTTQHHAQPQNGPSSSQPWNTSVASNAQRSLNASAPQPLQAMSRPVHEVTSGSGQPFSVEMKSTGRKELPADLFTATYPSYHAAPHGWQAIPPRHMGFNMQYIPAAMPFHAFQHPAKPSNPFDLRNDPPPQIQTFPSMASLQGALPNALPPAALLHANLGSGSPAWMPSQAIPHSSGMPFQAPGHHPSGMPSRYLPHQMPNNMLPSHTGGFRNVGGASLGTHSTNQQLAGPFSAPPNPHSFPSGGNPFG